MRQRSCACPVMDIGSWCNNSRRRTAGFSRRFTESDYEDEFDEMEYPIMRSSASSRWRGLWRRIMKGKRRILNSSAPQHVPYDAYSYAQNFDDGSSWIEPENLSRSFSARFADPSRILRRLPWYLCYFGDNVLKQLFLGFTSLLLSSWCYDATFGVVCISNDNLDSPFLCLL